MPKPPPGGTTRRFNSATGDSGRYVIATTHQGDQHHPFPIQTTLLFDGQGIVYVDMRWTLIPTNALAGPISHVHRTPEHERIDIFAQNSINNSLSLQQGTLGLGLPRCHMIWEAEQLQQMFRHDFWKSTCIPSTALVALDRRLMGAIKDEERLYGVLQEA